MFQAGGELSLVCAFPRRDTCDEVQFIHRTTFAGFLCEHLPPGHTRHGGTGAHRVHLQGREVFRPRAHHGGIRVRALTPCHALPQRH